MRYLASIGLMGMHVFEEATSEGSGEPAHWHSLSRAYNLSIHKAQKYLYARKHEVLASIGLMHMHILKRLAVKAHASLHIGTVLSGPTLYANIKCGSICWSG